MSRSRNGFSMDTAERGQPRRRVVACEHWRSWIVKSNSQLVAGMLVLLHITTALTLDVHISASDPGGTIVYNGSHGPGWSYLMEGHYNQRTPHYLQLDSSTGVVYLKQNVQCYHSRDNPDTFRVIARTRYSSLVSNYTITPFKLFIHECGDNHIRTPSVRHSHFIVIYSNYTHTGCIPSGHHIASLLHYLPLSLKQCAVIVNMPVAADLHVDVNTLEITTIISRCLKNGEFVASFDVLFACEKSSIMVPYKLVLHSFDTKFHPDHLKIKKSRSRRAVENNPPYFDQPQYIENVKENQRPGTVVATITATDPDANGASQITYTLYATRNELSQTMFAIHPTSGTINTTKVLDREQMHSHYFMIIARDDVSGDSSSGTASLVIRVDDTNDNSPIFEKQHYTRNITENLHAGFNVLTVQATDKDFMDNADIRYTILNTGGQPLPFMIEPLSGTITTREVLDRETRSFYHFLVQAVDQGETSKRRTATTTVDIQITDENDNKPLFSKTSFRISVPEDIVVTSRPVILNLNATDRDTGPNAEIRYSLLGNIDDTFYINSETGEISIVKPLDYEVYKEYKLNVRAEDGGIPSQKSLATVIVEVEDKNDNEPKFYSTAFQESVYESDPSGTSILQVQARDADSGENGRVTYEIINAPKNMPLTIDSSKGWIVTNALLDREKDARFEFNVRASDHGTPPKTTVVTVTILVQDVNDNAPRFTNRTYYASVLENVKIGTNVIAVTAVDRDSGDNARVLYEITDGNPRNVFQISRVSGEGRITVQGRLDAREKDQYKLVVEARDPGGKTDTAEVIVSVMDTNKNRPAFQNIPYSKHVDENLPIGTSVFKVMALDSDRGENARITYSIDPATTFSIDPNSGEITTRQELDRESIAVHTLTVTATDHGIPQLQDNTEVDIIIDDINDNSPEFNQQEYEGSISEDTPPGISVIQIQAVDRDQGPNKQIEYTFEGGNSGNGDFKIDSARGIIRIDKELDRERVASYELVAFAKDKGKPSLSTSVKIKIKVLDVNDNQPVFPDDVIVAPVAEDVPIGSTVCVITATDPDEGENALVEYSFVGGADVDSFKLVGRQGDPAIITSLIHFDYESSKKEYEVKLRASSDRMISTATIKIKVVDVNDNSPKLEDFTIIFNNYPQNFPSGPIGRVPATDPDESDQPKLRYKFVSGNEAGLLQLNETTGEITLDARLNSDVPRIGTFEVSVSDGKNTVKAGCQLYVRLVTEDMLLNSVTIRLDKMTEQTFLSPSFQFFTDALATILHVEDTQIYIINVENDRDVKGQVLNVSVSVLQKKISNNRDVFYPPEYIQENIYLQRSLLANLSALQVLPFDDNLCVQEMCYNFEVCQSKLIFDQAANFIKSDTMFFRPIHPENGYRCVCPQGFTGQKISNLCDVEVDLCYSKPCQNGGTCKPREGGYTCFCTDSFEGLNCEVNNTVRFDSDTCPSHLCHPPSRCVPLIRGGFRCDGCPTSDDYDEYCRLTKRSFSKGSFLTFPSLKRRNHFSITLEFATQQKNGLLYYNGRFNELHDFIALEIIEGQVQFSFSLGENITTVSPYIEGGVNTGEWTKVKVEYLNREATVTVGEKCDTLISILYGQQLGNYTCAARTAMVLDKKCENPTIICHRLLDLTGPLQIGGLPSLPTTFQIRNKDFVGCIKDFYIDHDILNLNSSMSHVGRGTEEGCPAKKPMCSSKPCLYGGVCKEGWNTFTCECPDRSGGLDCGQPIDPARKLNGNGYLSYFDDLRSVDLKPWYNGIAFRTRELNGALMQIILSSGEVRIQLEDGYVSHTYGSDPPVIFDLRRVNDGKWHYFETRWFQGRLELLLDYGQLRMEVEKSSSISGSSVNRVYVGGFRAGNGPITNGFKGCVKDIRMGNNGQAVLKTSTNGGNGVEEGCSSADVCGGNPCGAGACVDEWEAKTCLCNPGHIGPQCKDVCGISNPCQNYSTCRRPNSHKNDYYCECGVRQTGQYCQVTSPKECPAAWYGYPVCGPCNCPTHRGFSSSCNKTTGECLCKTNYYRPEGSDTCYPCNCYRLGIKSAGCNPKTGQCSCKSGIVGQRCDQCPSIFAEIKEGSCVVNYDNCPRNMASGIWWDQVAFGDTAHVDCPGTALGDAVRKCTESYSWLEPDLFNCTSANFTELRKQIDQLRMGINTFVAKSTIDSLKNATNTTRPMYGGDISTTYHILTELLNYEKGLTGLSLTSEQHATYIQHMLIAWSNVTEKENSIYWDTINEKWDGASKLLNLFEEYIITLTTSFATTKTPAFDAISDNMVLGVDWIAKTNSTRRTVPKYDHIQKKGMFDEDSHVALPVSMFRSTTVSVNDAVPKAYVGYILYNTFDNILPTRYDGSVTVIEGIPIKLNAPVMTVIVIDNGAVVHQVVDPVNVTMKLVTNSNRTRPQCVYWKAEGDNRGSWSREGCSLIDRYMKNGEDYVVCSCQHLSTFSVLMDVAGVEYLYAVAEIEIPSYFLVAVSLACLLLAFLIFMTFKRLQCNWNSIHINIVFIIFVTQLAYIIGIGQVRKELFCKLISITLHYFYIALFAWLFVDVLHIYRMLTEMRIINYGSMKFYYLVGYVIPGIIVGLSVGLNTAGYENRKFCWMSVSDMFIWSFAGPVVIGVLIHIFTFILAMKASCREKIREPENLNSLRCGLMAAIFLLLLVSVTWVVGLISVNFNMPTLHYVFAIFMCLEGVFIFLAYVLLNAKVRLQIKRAWYRMQGKKLEIDENLAGTRSTMLSRSALAYRHDSSNDGGLHRVNIGISTTSTTSRSSKSSGTFHKGDDYLRSTSSSTSGHVPSAPYMANSGLPPYGYDPSAFHDKLGESTNPDFDTGEITRKTGNNSDSDSEMSEDRNSLDLASSHSSDEDDEFDIGPHWEKTPPKSKAVAQAREEIEKKKKERELDRIKNNNSDGLWSGEGDTGRRFSPQLSQQPDVLLPASERPGRVVTIVPPVRSDSLQNNISSTGTSATSPSQGTRVQVLTHNGSVSSDSESSNETNV